MNNFWTLVGFEYKKIIIRKSVWVCVLLAVIATVFSVCGLIIGGNPATGMSNYDEMLMDKAYKLTLSGRQIDGDLILEASQAYQKVPSNVYPYTDSEEYQKFARPYFSVYALIDSAYTERGHAFNIDDFQTISEEDAFSYYDKRINQYRLNLQNNPSFTQQNIDRVIEIDNEVQKPFIMEYTDGYERFFSLSTTNAFIIMFLIAFTLSPIFVNEYSQKTDSLILTSKNGKHSQILAKIFTGGSFSILLSLFLSLVGYLLCMFIYGFEGANAPIQLHIPLITYNFTMIEAVFLLCITTVFGSLLMTGICLFLSSVIDRSIVVLTISTIVILLGMFNGIFPTAIEKVRFFLPSPMGTYFDVVLNQYSWNVFGINIWLYQAICGVAFIVGTLLLTLSYHNFKKHQIS
ncbi:ABC transporter permease [Sporosalibacterium faouarense]|uniref:ABC transporter permease n=1 Tax=Sporosalibacterium faouarense TaxID=516123 RepID=UPI00192BFA69|nr:ABC transporter permease [Sporosalibacterium faouarense]